MKISNQHLAIGIPCTFPFIPRSFFNSWVYLEHPDFTYIPADNGPIDTLRNDIVAKALSLSVTQLIMMDVDMVYHPQTINKLLSHRLPIVGAMAFRRYPPFDPIMLKVRKDKLGYEGIEDWEPGDLIDVDATGAGCLMFDMQLFRDMDRRAKAEIDAFNKLRPSSEELATMSESTRQYIIGLQQRCVHPHHPGIYFKFYKDADTGATIGEDVGFCQDLKAAGYKIFVDTSVPADHLTTMCVNYATHKLYRSMKEKQHKQNLEQALMGKVTNNFGGK